MAVFGAATFNEVIKVIQGLWGWTLISMTGVPTRRGNTDKDVNGGKNTGEGGHLSVKEGDLRRS